MLAKYCCNQSKTVRINVENISLKVAKQLRVAASLWGVRRTAPTSHARCWKFPSNSSKFIQIHPNPSNSSKTKGWLPLQAMPGAALTKTNWMDRWPLSWTMAIYPSNSFKFIQIHPNPTVSSPQHAPCNGDSIGNMWCANKEGERITDVGHHQRHHHRHHHKCHHHHHKCRHRCQHQLLSSSLLSTRRERACWWYWCGDVWCDDINISINYNYMDRYQAKIHWYGYHNHDLYDGHVIMF